VNARHIARLLGLLSICACGAREDIYLGADYAPPSAQDSGREPAADSGRAGGPASPPPVTDGGPPPDAAPPSLVCGSRQADCDSDAGNGCETDLTSDARHCGQCGRACSDPDCACRDGRLETLCPSGRADCDGSSSNGCEVDIRTSMDHCGSCGRRCHTDGHDAITAVCTAGTCHITCEAELVPEGDCDGNPDNGCETSLQTDQNCGACGVRCTCSNGICL
jgi:hypothetical protein